MTNPEQTNERIISIISPGENVRWIGKPSIEDTIQHNSQALSFGLIFIVAPWFSKTISSSTFVLSILFGLVWIVRALAEIILSRSTAFAITDRRVLLVQGVNGARVFSWLPDSINVTEKKVRGDGSGSVYFQAQRVNGVEAGGIHKVGFHGVHDVEIAYEALTRLANSRTDVQSP